MSRIEKELFEQLFDRYYTGLCAYALRFVDSYNVAEDIVQDVFCSLWKVRDGGAIHDYKSYLFNAVRNRCLDYLRHHRLVDAHCQDQLNRGIVSTNFTWEMFVESELSAMLETALDQLPEELRSVFVLNKLEGRTAAEISELVGVSVRTIEGRIDRAKKLLREKLRAFDFTEFSLQG